jgi:hypothetical protein
MRLSFIQLTPFRVNWKRLGMDDEDLQALELEIMEDPAHSPMMSGTGGLRKIRFSSRRSSRGKSGGVRVCFAYFQQFALVYLFAVFPKNEKANLDADEKRDYRAALKHLERNLLDNFSKGWTP